MKLTSSAVAERHHNNVMKTWQILHESPCKIHSKTPLFHLTCLLTLSSENFKPGEENGLNIMNINK